MNDAIATSFTPDQEYRRNSWKAEQEREAGDLLTRYQEAVARGDAYQIRRLCRLYLLSPAARNIAAIRALKGNWTVREAIALARRIRPFSRQRDVVLWWWKEKENKPGSYRILCELPLTLKGCHFLIRDVLRAHAGHIEHSYDVRGRGRDALTLDLAAAISAGANWGLKGDLSDCFQSVDVEGLYGALPLPTTVIANCLDIRNLRLCRANNSAWLGNYVPQWNGPRGLLQGSPVSNTILTMLLEDLPSALPPYARPFLFSDNIFVASNLPVRDRVSGPSLCRYFAEHRAGPFRLNVEHVNLAHGEFENLGYKFELGSQVVISPSDWGWQRMWGRMAVAENIDFEWAHTPCATAAAARRFVAGFPLWSEGPQWVEDFLDNMETFLPFPRPREA